MFEYFDNIIEYFDDIIQYLDDTFEYFDDMFVCRAVYIKTLDEVI